MLMAKLYWWPQFQVTGREAYEYIHASMKHRYFVKLQDLAAGYIESFASLCYCCTEVQKTLERPNTHCHFESFMHTIQLFGHSLFVLDITFKVTRSTIEVILV